MKFRFWWGVAVLYMAVIFYLSHQPAVHSNELSTSVTEVVIELVGEEAFQPPSTLDQLNHLLRKSTHFIAYFGLAIVFWMALAKKGFTRYLLAWGLATLYAFTDEFHQLFVEGRGGQLRDVGIDSSGAALAMLVLFGIQMTRRLLSPGRKSS